MSKNNFDIDNKDFDKFINVNIYINGLFLLDKEEDKHITFKINLSNFQNHRKENCSNIIKISRDHKIPIKNILYSIFINNRIDNIDIIWSPSAIKEFRYVPIKHYLEFEEDSLYLKTKKFKFKKSF